ncbi:plastocyanin/azurin family copper-binding protein [Volucribacter amazonae]|uniref:Pseudoazurin n=1 Tax=Volucribacter amazonae TaxID=256731 RepID=A0A9X4PG75_9PAST|nr:plastocyanin/azurin family copper-binding protein [Volucribacter amazonae]MDG6894580.1 pseudoazurin [Volucribacter amazonae]
MKKSLSILTLLFAFSSATFANQHHEIQMLDYGEGGSMVFEPAYLKANVGDTVTFKATHKGHWVQSKTLPEGVTEFLSEDGQDFTITLSEEGIYVYTCPPHRMVNMNGVIQAGNPVNLEQAKAMVFELDKRSMQNKGRLTKYFSE